MKYTAESVLPENMQPLIITAAPFGPEWLPGDADIPVTWDEQVQAAIQEAARLEHGEAAPKNALTRGEPVDPVADLLDDDPVADLAADAEPADAPQRAADPEQGPGFQAPEQA